MCKTLFAIFKFNAKSIAAFCAILFVTTTTLVLLLFNAENTLLNAETYKHALAENGVYEQLPTLAAGETDAINSFLASHCVNDSQGCANGMVFINNLTTKDWHMLISLLLPPDEARVMAENILDQMFAYINGETNTVNVSLLSLKTHLTGQTNENLIQLLLNAQPPCTEEQLAQIFAGQVGDTGQPAFCNPPQQVQALFKSVLQVQLDSYTAGIPDKAVIIERPTGLDSSSKGPLGNALIATLNTVRLGIRFSPVVPLSLLIMVTLLSIRSLKSWLSWWGIPLFITGLIVAVIGMTILPLLDWAWVKYILPQFPSTFPASITILARSLAGSIVQTMTIQITFEAVTIGLLGLAAIIGSFFTELKLKKTVPLGTIPEPK